MKQEAEIRDEHEKWLDLMGYMACQKRNLVFSIFYFLKKPFFSKKKGRNSKFRKLIKVHRDYFENHVGPVRVKTVGDD